ncbi:hypothetical protein [Aliarcobacter butzleri]|uniref:hypothetical protein n=1 Tax=Aliarcobacter butzleri TaxID=28197 RepID=UPI002B250369|nr:hypothetical protein [Aliarcobacter butzleri]
MIDKDFSTQDYIDLLEKIKKNPKDIGRIGAELGICGIGGIALSGFASTAAISTSTATVLGSSTLGTAVSTIGLGALTVTPVGWIIGLSALGAFSVYGLIKVYKSGLKAEELKKELKKDLEEKLAKTKKDINTEKDLSKKLAKLASIYFELGKLGIIKDREVLKNITYGILENKIDIDSALKDLEILIRDLDIKIENS